MGDAATARIERLGVLGGTFDPIHVGHLIAASEAFHALGLDRVLFVPAGRPWQKDSYSTGEDRYLMTVIGVASDPRFAVSRIELDRPGPTYTADTMTSLRDFYGARVELFFLCGADAVLKLSTWKLVDKLAELADVVALTRPGFELGEFEPVAGMPDVRTVRMPLVEASATDIRDRVRTGRPIDYLVPTDVRDYIRAQGLYLNGGGLDGG